MLDIVRQQKQAQEEARSGPQIFFRAEQKKKYLSSQVFRSPNDGYVIVQESEKPFDFGVKPSNLVPRPGIVHSYKTAGDEVVCAEGPAWQSNDASRKSLKMYREQQASISQIGPSEP